MPFGTQPAGPRHEITHYPIELEIRGRARSCSTPGQSASLPLSSALFTTRFKFPLRIINRSITVFLVYGNRWTTPFLTAEPHQPINHHRFSKFRIEPIHSDVFVFFPSLCSSSSDQYYLNGVTMAPQFNYTRILWQITVKRYRLEARSISWASCIRPQGFITLQVDDTKTLFNLYRRH